MVEGSWSWLKEHAFVLAANQTLTGIMAFVVGRVLLQRAKHQFDMRLETLRAELTEEARRRHLRFEEEVARQTLAAGQVCDCLGALHQALVASLRESTLEDPRVALRAADEFLRPAREALERHRQSLAPGVFVQASGYCKLALDLTAELSSRKYRSSTDFELGCADAEQRLTAGHRSVVDSLYPNR